MSDWSSPNRATDILAAIEAFAADFGDFGQSADAFYTSVYDIARRDHNRDSEDRAFQGWSRQQARDILIALRSHRLNSNDPVDQDQVPIERVKQWAPLFLTHTRVGAGAEGGVHVEAWLLRGLPTRTRDMPMLYAMITSVAERHGDGVGWHIHPVDRRGRHYGYRMLFDRQRCQDLLSWEAHGSTARASRPWGEPAEAVLAEGTGRALYYSALKACAAEHQLSRQKFRSWAARFCPPSTSTYLAVDRHRTDVPTSPVPWSDARCRHHQLERFEPSQPPRLPPPRTRTSKGDKHMLVR